jgi:hypothetical protein
MGTMKNCPICGKSHEYPNNFKHCDKCLRTGCTWCMSKGTGGETMCCMCKQGRAKPIGK